MLHPACGRFGTWLIASQAPSDACTQGAGAHHVPAEHELALVVAARIPAEHAAAAEVAQRLERLRAYLRRRLVGGGHLAAAPGSVSLTP